MVCVRSTICVSTAASRTPRSSRLAETRCRRQLFKPYTDYFISFSGRPSASNKPSSRPRPKTGGPGSCSSPASKPPWTRSAVAQYLLLDLTRITPACPSAHAAHPEVGHLHLRDPRLRVPGTQNRRRARARCLGRSRGRHQRETIVNLSSLFAR